MNLKIPTLHERILTMTDEELEDLATGEALAIAESSKLEGLVLDQDRIFSELLTGYHAIRNQEADFVR